MGFCTGTNKSGLRTPLQKMKKQRAPKQTKRKQQKKENDTQREKNPREKLHCAVRDQGVPIQTPERNVLKELVLYHH